MIEIINLTPHPITIIRSCPDPSGPPDASIEHRTEYPACAPADLPRATEVPDGGDMALTDSGSDGQGGYENSVSLRSTGLVDFVGYAGIEGLPEVSVGDRMFGLTTFRIVSIVTAIGALAAGRGIEDLLVPMGQVRDAQGRIIGATGLAPAASLLAPMYRRMTEPLQQQIIEALQERNAARAVVAVPAPGFTVPNVSIANAPTVDWKFTGDVGRAELAGAKAYAEMRADGCADLRVTDATGKVLAEIVVHKLFADENITVSLMNVGSALLWSHMRWIEAIEWAAAHGVTKDLGKD